MFPTFLAHFIITLRMYIDGCSLPALFHSITLQPWWLPYLESPVHSEFQTFIYSFTWEDPHKDLEYIDMGPKDTVFAITSAGDNILHYAINAKPAKIHAVDVNPWLV